MKFGLLLPHFGDHCSVKNVLGHVRWMEEAGFNSVWVRDHLEFHPHEFEGKSSVFLEPFTTLAAIAARTERLVLGTATIITFRHPLVTSQLVGTLAYLANGNRLIIGVGTGVTPQDFCASGLPFEKRGKIVEELLQILRLTWGQDHASFHGEFYHFEDITIEPKPPVDTPIYYGGWSKAGLRRTVTYCDGWLPQRMPYKVLDKLTADLQAMQEKYQSRKKIAITYFPLCSIDRDSARARKRIGIERIVGELKTLSEEDGWGVEATEENLGGMIIVGSPQQFVDEIGKFVDRGIDEIAFDLRNTFDEWEKSLELLAAEVLPHFKENRE